MPHVDDGTLHALLDGALGILEPEHAGAVRAHLESCAECRSRLDEAAALRERADGVLGLLEPAADPDFQEVLVRAGARRTGLRAQLRWTRGAAWAATLVVALGTGYLIRDRMVPDRAVTIPATETMESIGAPAADAGRGVAQEEAAAPPEAVEGALPERGGPARLPTSTRSETPAVADAAPPPGAVPGGDVAEPQLGLAAATAAAATGAAAKAAPAGRVTLTGPVAAEGQEPREVAPGDVERLVGAPLMVLPGGEVVRTLVRTGATVEVVSLQRLSGGVEIRVTQRPATVALEGIVVTAAAAEQRAPAAPSPAPSASRAREAVAADALVDAGNSAVVGAGVLGWELRLEGPLPREALAALGTAARPWAPAGGS